MNQSPDRAKCSLERSGSPIPTLSSLVAKHNTFPVPEVIFIILADFSYFGTNAQNFHNTNFGFNSVILAQMHKTFTIQILDSI
jgi:hypothetical protein